MAAVDKHPSEGLNIYQILDRVSQEAGALAPESKGGVPFAFRGIDGTVAHLSPPLRKYGVVVVPRVIQHDVSSNPSGNKVVTTSEITTEFTFYAPDGSSVVATTAGLANDFADRSAAQAQSVAFRIALLQVFALPTHSPEPEQTGVEREAPQAVPVKAAPAETNVKKLQAEIKEAAKAAAEKIDDLDANYYSKLGAKLFPEDKTWASNETKLKKVLEAVKAGELP